MASILSKNPNFDIGESFRYYALLLDDSNLPSGTAGNAMRLTVYHNDSVILTESFIQQANKVGHYYVVINAKSPTFVMGWKYLFLTEWTSLFGVYANNECLQCRNTRKIDFIYNKETVR
jgi:hypothetical protein